MGVWPISVRQAIEAEPKSSGGAPATFIAPQRSLLWAILKNSFGVEESRLQVRYTINTIVILLHNGCGGPKEGSAS
jgi:hypothetical protein